MDNNGVGILVRAIALGILLLVGTGAQETASDAPADDAPAAVEKALKRLESADWKDRRDAEQQLVDLGQAATVAIKKVLPATRDAEVRTHLEAALQRIEQNDRIGPTPITLHLKESSPQKAFAELNKQSRVPLLSQPEDLFEHGLWGKADIELVRRPYWESVRLLCQKFHVEPRALNDGLRLMSASDGHGQFDGPVSIDGPFLIVANTVYRNVAVHLADRAVPAAKPDQPVENFALQLTAFAEPKLAVLRCDGPVTLDEASDENGHSLLPPEGATGVESFSGGKGAWTLHAPLSYPAERPGKHIAKLKGTVSFLVRTKAQKVEIPNVLEVREVHQKVGELPLTIKDFKKNGDHYELRVSLSLDVLQEKSWSAIQQSMQGDLRIYDDADHPLISRSFSSRAADNNDAVEFLLGFARALPGEKADDSIGEPEKLIWEIPVETERCKVHFEFKDLPMP